MWFATRFFPLSRVGRRYLECRVSGDADRSCSAISVTLGYHVGELRFYDCRRT